MKVINPTYKRGRDDVYQRGLNADYHLPRTAKQERQNAAVLSAHTSKPTSQLFRDDATASSRPLGGGGVWSESLHPRDQRGRFRNK